MSDIVWRSKDGAVSVDSYVGPELKQGFQTGRERRRIQVTVVSDEDGRHHSASLSLAEFRQFVSSVRNY